MANSKESTYLQTEEAKREMRLWEETYVFPKKVISLKEFQSLVHLVGGRELNNSIKERNIRSFLALLAGMRNPVITVDQFLSLQEGTLAEEQENLKHRMVIATFLTRLFRRLEKKGRYTVVEVPIGLLTQMDPDDYKFFKNIWEEEPTREILEKVNRLKERYALEQRFDVARFIRDIERSVQRALRPDTQQIEE
jgi:hypothetical protein